MSWQYNKIPEHQHNAVIEAVEKRDLQKLLSIHNEYKLSTHNYTCCGIDDLIKHFKYAIEIGEVKAN